MSGKRFRKTENAKAAAKADLVRADEQAAKAQKGLASNAGVFQKKIARRMRRQAKRRMSKADRRQGRAICEQWEDLDDYELS